MNTNSFDICFFGTPKGFEQVTVQGGFSLDLMRLLDFDTSRVEPVTGENLWRILERNYSGNSYRIIALYTPVFEIDSLRPGGFCGVALIFKNAYVSDAQIIPSLLSELLQSLIALSINNGKFKSFIKDVFANIKIPAELSRLKNSLVTGRNNDAVKVLSNSTLFITAGKGLDFPSIAGCLNFLLNTQLASRFNDVCIIPEGPLIDKSAFRSKANSLSFLNAVNLLSISESKLTTEFNLSLKKNNELNILNTTLRSELEAANAKLSGLELQLNLLNSSKPSAVSSSASTIPAFTSRQSIPPTQNNFDRPTQSSNKLASSNEAIKNTKLTERTIPKSDSGLFSLVFSIAAFVLLLCGAFYGTIYLMNSDFSFSTSQPSKAKVENTEKQQARVSSSHASEDQKAIVSVDKNLPSISTNSSPPVPSHLPASCSYMEATKIDYLFKRQDQSLKNLNDVAKFLTLDLCTPLKGCEKSIVEDMVNINPSISRSKEISDEPLKIRVADICEIRDPQFTVQKSRRK